MSTGNPKEEISKGAWKINNEPHRREKLNLIAAEKQIEDECMRLSDKLANIAKKKLSSGDYITVTDTETTKKIRLNLMTHISSVNNIRYKQSESINSELIKKIAAGLKIDTTKIKIISKYLKYYDGSWFKFNLDNDSDMCFYTLTCCLPLVVNICTTLFHIANRTYKDTYDVILEIELL